MKKETPMLSKERFYTHVQFHHVERFRDVVVDAGGETFDLVAYAVFFATFLYLIAFVGDLPLVPVTVDRGPEAAVGTAFAVNLGLIAPFGLQHSAMARQGFKRWWTRPILGAEE